MLVGAMSPDMDFRFRALAFAVILLAFIRPLAVRLGLSVLAPPTPQRKQIEWVGVRGAASLYCLAFAIDHGLGGRFGHQLAGITLVVMAGSILAHGLTASPVRTASPGALSS
jgi:NhaP-type Na+/H+ or K+/H+ antiporter